jgi:hypothetical protein
LAICEARHKAIDAHAKKFASVILLNLESLVLLQENMEALIRDFKRGEQLDRKARFRPFDK